MKKLLVNRWFWVSVIIITLILNFFVGTNAGKTDDKQRILAQMIVQSLEEYHFSPQKLDDKFSERVFDLFIKKLDYNKRIFYKSDIEEIKHYRTEIDDQLKIGSIEFYNQTSEILKKRVVAIRSITQEILKKPFDFTVEESLETDPLKRDFPENEAQLWELWRLILKYQTEARYLELIQKGKKITSYKNLQFQPELEVEARESVAKNTQRMLERMLQRNDENRFNQYLGAISESFDPHTEYFPPQEKENFDISMTGTLEGIGALLREDNEYTTVQDIIPGSPAWRQKELKPEDVILKVGQGDNEPVDVVGMPVNDVVRLIRGKRGTEVRLTVKKPDGRIVIIPIIRDIVIVEETYAKSAVIVNQKIGKRIGYISLPSFYHDFKSKSARDSASDVKKELEKLKAEKVAGIILDLRNNGGGALDDAIKTAGLFIKSGPVVQVKDGSGNGQIYRDPDPEIVYSGPVVVLVNSFSASASEIVAAALQDYGRAVIVGSPHTFGKGTVQAMLDLDNMVGGSSASLKPLGSLKITIQKYYRINGGSTQEKGVLSDIVLPDAYSSAEVGEKSLDYHLPWDTVSQLSYKKWGNQKLNLALLKQKSAKRLEFNRFFKQLNQQITRLKTKQDNTVENLKLTKFLEKQDNLKTDIEELEDLQPEQSDVKVLSPQAGLKKGKANSDSKKTAEWHKQLNRDAYINEAIFILNDMLSLK